VSIDHLGSIQAIQARIQQLEQMLGGGTATAPASATHPTDAQGLPDTTEVQSFQQVLGQQISAPSQVADPQALEQGLEQSPSGLNNLTGNNLTGLINQLSARHGVNAKLINAVVKQESGFNPLAMSKTGAMGLMQLMPATAKSLGVQKPFNPADNLNGGITYLKGLIQQYKGNVPKALAAYNAGPGAVNKYGGIPPYQETRQYVRNIMNTLNTPPS
jgi:soluble lytic murein transglycosylase-like protein